MSSRARVRQAMTLAVPDRVPVFCQLAIGHYFLNAGPAPFDIWYRSAAFAEALVTLQRRYRFDGILVNLPGRDPEFERWVERVDDEQGAIRVRWKDRSYTRVPPDDNPHHFRPDATRAFPTFDAIDPERLWYVEPWDVTGVTHPFRWGFDPEPRTPDDFFPVHHLDAIRAVIAKTGGDISVHSEVFSPFSQLLELVNYEGALAALREDPGKVHACLDRLTDGAVDLACRQAGAGVDAILVSSAFAGSGFISRPQYTEYVLPYERRLIASVHERFPDVILYTHTCGGIGDRLDLMLETGTQGVDTLDPPPIGTVVLEDAVPQLEGKAFIKGNIDPVNTLLHGDEAAVRDAVLHRLEVAAPGGGYILSSACSVAPRVKPALVEYLSAVAIEHGVYRE